MVKHNAIEIRRRRTALSLSRFGPDFPENRVRCLSVRIFPVSILSAVRILSGLWTKAARCLSVRPDKDETELSELSLSLTADV